MVTRFRKNRFHILIWITMFLYMAIAPGFFDKFALTEGKPVHVKVGIPSPTDQILFAVDKLETNFSNGKEIYTLWGWAFLQNAEQSKYDRKIVLQSDRQVYFFAVDSVERPDVQQTYGTLGINVLDAGLSTTISKEALKPGIYAIGILFKDKNSDEAYFVVTNKVLVRTPNHLTLEYTR